MKIRFAFASLALACALTFSSTTALAQQATSPAAPRAGADYGVGHFGLGLILGSPTGVIGKYRFTELIGIDFMAGLGWFGGGHFYTRADVLFEFKLAEWRPGALDLFFGIGPQIGVYYDSPWISRDQGVWFGARSPVGVSWYFSRVPVDIFVETSFGLWFVQEPWFDFGAATGARYWF